MSKILLIMPFELGGEIYMLSNRLKRRGFEVVIAGREDEWIEIVQNELPDLILVDMTCLTPQGEDLMIQNLNTVQASQKMSIIFIIDQKTRIYKQNFIDVDYYLKPIRVPNLLEKINRLLSGPDLKKMTKE